MQRINLRLARLVLLASCAALTPRAPLAQEVVPQYLDRNITAGVMGTHNDRNAIVSGNQMLERLRQQNQMTRWAQWAAEGEQRIARGQASLSYQPSPAASVLGQVDSAQRERLSRTLAGFATTLRAKGLHTNDLADCESLAFMMGFYGLRGEDPGPSRLAKFRAQTRVKYLKDPMVQGMPDDEKQKMCERWGIGAVVAAAARDLSAQPSRQTDLIELAAQANAASVTLLRSLTSTPPEAIELTADGFGDRGARLAVSGIAGGATTSFRRSADNPAFRSFESAMALRAGTAERVFQQWLSTVRERGGSENDLADIFTTGAAVLLQLRDSGRTVVSANGWRSARDHEREGIGKSVDWQRMTDAKRQETADGFALRVMWLVEKLEANKQAMAQPPPSDPIKRALWVRPLSNAGAISEEAGAMLARWYPDQAWSVMERKLRQ